MNSIDVNSIDTESQGHEGMRNDCDRQWICMEKICHGSALMRTATEWNGAVMMGDGTTKNKMEE